MNFENFYTMQPVMPQVPNRPTNPQPVPSQPSQPIQPEQPMQPEPPVIRSTDYIQGYLRTMIGKYVKVEFVLGTNMLIDREGILLEVGIDHIVIQEPETDDHVIADLYSIKFVRVFY